LRTSCQKRLCRPSGGRTGGGLKLIEIKPKEFSNKLETSTSRQTGQGHAISLDKRGSRDFWQWHS
jgi:hypothetical protein